MGCSSSRSNNVRPDVVDTADSLPALADEASKLSEQLCNSKTFEVKEEGVVVLVRVRPSNDKEKTEGGKPVLDLQSSTQLRIPENKANPQERTFAYDAVLAEGTSQEEVYKLCGPRILDKAMQGYHATLFAYGQTGSGKTWTMHAADSCAAPATAPLPDHSRRAAASLNGWSVAAYAAPPALRAPRTYASAEGAPGSEGVIPRLSADLFQEAAAMSAKGVVVRVTASYIEIYQEVLRDLLVDDKAEDSLSASATAGGAAKPAIREHKTEGVYLENVAERPVSSAQELDRVFREGAKRRATGETAMNAGSSRSHAVLTLRVTGETAMNADSSRSRAVLTLRQAMPIAVTARCHLLLRARTLALRDTVVEQRDKTDMEGLVAIKSKVHLIDLAGSERSHSQTTHIHLIDLAGSERAKATGAEGDRLKEGANINKSLSALGNVIAALTATNRKHVPYRDSKLTRLLQDSLGGSAFCMVICNVSPSSTCEGETVSTLRFAERLKKVKNRVHVHVDASARKIVELQSQVRALRNRVAELEALLGQQRGHAAKPPP
ncbi:P-loop containing nucleoside triphosphate hydrolase protein [Tribonema minus]|uniref:P-loop containing nucleoside triphosphate hydrolase protein n=1 Tax=Tribonema minus TaxID=303371 RepID=A0A835Z0B7_9STRA|nr:P-loop containing nucleoside triphosphate hydrolase protein [Tribonema minus]